MRPSSRLAIAAALAALFCATFPLPAMALSSDRDKPMHIEADRAELDDQTGISTYTGNVEVTQGSMTLHADTITVHNLKRRIIKVVAEGGPAHFKQRPDNQTQDVVAEANRIEYDGGKEQLTLSGGAKVSQAENVFHSDRIVYDIQRNVANAGGESSEMTEQSRVRITIQPDRKPANKTAAPEPQ